MFRLLFLVALLAGCGTAPTAPPREPGAVVPTDAPLTASPAIDPAPFLADVPPTELRAAVVPRAAWLDVGGPQLSPEGEPRDPVEVVLVESGATQARVAVRLPHVRYVLWVRRDDLLAVLAHDLTLGSPLPERPGLTLRRGSRVEILSRTAERARVRYSGGVELETEVSRSALLEQGEMIDGGSPIFAGRRLFHAMPGLPIRSEPRFSGQPLAVLARTYILEEVRPIDEAWSEVQYNDGAVSVRGFLSRREPPHRLARRASDAAPAAFASNDTLPAAVCLFAAPGGEAIGVTVGPAPALVEPTEREQWHAVTLDTPWAPIRFHARRTQGTWQACPAPSQ